MTRRLASQSKGVRLIARRAMDWLGPRRHRWALPALVFAGSLSYFALGLAALEPSLLESQDFGIACELFRTFGLSADHSPLHFALVNLWQRLNATSIAFLRFPSAVFCALGVLVVFHLARQVAGRGGGLLAAVLLATNPLVVDIARSMRLYSLVVLLAAASLWSAHACWSHPTRQRYLAGFVAASVLGIYTHLFFWLWAGSIGLLLGIDLMAHRSDRARLRRAMIWAAAGASALIPQVIHGYDALGFTRERQALYPGLGGDPFSFLTGVARTLLLGDPHLTLPLASWWLLLPIALLLVGVRVLGRPGLWVAAAGFLPSLVVAWALGFSHQVEARYLSFLTPLMALFMGVGAVKAVRARWRVLVVAPSLGLFVYVNHAAYSAEPTDWYAAAARITALRGPDDVVAVFPGYWDWTFRRYGRLGETSPVTLPVDLDRVLARGKRVLLVHNSGRYFGNMEAFLRANTRYKLLFSSSVRRTLDVYSVTGKASARPPSREQDPVVLLLGAVGSGGYFWQQRPPAQNPFAGLGKLVTSSDLVLAGYTPYRPPWYVRWLMGLDQARALEPNGQVVRALREAGIQAVVSTCSAADCAGADSALGQNRLETVPSLAVGTAVEPRIYQLKTVRVGVLAIDRQSLGSSARPRHDGTIPPWVESGVTLARRAVGTDGHLVVIVPGAPDYGRLPTPGEELQARRLVDLGAEVVVGEGGYAAKEIEEYAGAIIAYSLGTLLRPPMLGSSARDSTGVALRIAFPAGQKPRYQVFPVTFDDRSEVALGRSSATRDLIRRSSGRASLTDRLATAEAGYESRSGERHVLGAWQPQVPAGGPQSSLMEWFPSQSRTSPLRPSGGGFGADGARVALRGVLSAGEYRRVIELDSGEHPAVWALFRGVPMGDALEIAYSLPDDRVRSKFLGPRDQTVVVTVGHDRVLERTVPYEIGWRVSAVDTSTLSGTTQDIQVLLRTHGTHFPVAFDLAVGRER